MNYDQYLEHLCAFLTKSSTPFHAVAGMAEFLSHCGFKRIFESDAWSLEKGQGYFLIRDQGAFLAFILGKEETLDQGLRLALAHTDSPCLQVKPCSEVKSGSFLQLGVEVYGGSLLTPWFDRDLSLAGRVCCKDEKGQFHILLVDFRRAILTIPSIAIHLDREANKALNLNQQKHLPPIIGQTLEKQLPDFNTLLLEQLKKEYPDKGLVTILNFDLFCYDTQPPNRLGIEGEILSAARLDNLLSCHAIMVSLGLSDKKKNCLMYCANHEEVGSMSMAGAQGSLLESFLERIMIDPVVKHIACSNSFMVSVDNAHAAHPNYMDKIDPAHEIHLNKGPVIKFNANQRYATSSLSAAVYKEICASAGIIPQQFVMRSDLPCGSTIGPFAAARLGIRTVDVGAATLAMHSIREHTGVSDPYLLFKTLKEFYRNDTHKILQNV